MTRRLKESAAHKPAEAAEKTWLSVQLKVLDIAGPLVYLPQLTKQGRQLDMEEVSENVKVALELTAAASYDINRRRRRNILNHTDPRSDYLLEDPKSFSSKQTVSSLFGKRYLEAMLKEADQDEKLSRRGPPGPAPKTASGPVTRSKSGIEGRGQFPFDNDRGGGRGRRYVPTQNDLIVSMPHPPPASFCGGRLRYFQTNWGRLSLDPWVLSTILNGLRIDFLSVPFQSFLPPMIRMAEEMEKFCDEEVVSLLEKKPLRRRPIRTDFLAPFL
jgi:hypothetical protein